MQNELQCESNKFEFGTLRRMQGILQVVSEELLDCPFYYQLDRLCCLSNCRMPPIKVFRSALINGGYKVSYSHALKNTIKTNEPNSFIWCIIKELHKSSNSKIKDSSPACVILNKNFVYKISLDVIEEEPKSKSLNLLRYQLNPEENWGPKSKPDNRVDKSKQNQGKRSHKSQISESTVKFHKSDQRTK